MATSHALPISLFNHRLVDQVLNKWYGEIPGNATSPDKEAAERWYGVGRTAEEKKAFDDELRDAFLPSLTELGQQAYPLPEPSDDERSPAKSRDILRPLLEVEGLWKGEGDERTALAIVLLLDQFSRNIFRDPSEQAVVYEHYDRIARALTRCCLSIDPTDPEGRLPNLSGLQDQRANKLNAIRLLWFFMPLMHSEDLKDHQLLKQRVSQYKAEIEANGDLAGAGFFGMCLDFEERHRVIIERFGRYPHRNKAMGRQMIEEEQKWLDEGGDTFGS